MKNLIIVTIFASIFLLLSMGIVLIDVPVETTTSSNNEKALNFNVKTVAICEDKDGTIYCHDEVIVNCEDEEYIVPKSTKSIKCGDLELETPLITAFAVFESDWDDPRILNE